MRDQPDGASLLEIARQTLRNDLIDALPAGKRYEALMIANAMAIAARQMTAGDQPVEGEIDTLRAILGIDEDLPTLNRELADRLRSGVFDPGAPDRYRVYEVLRETTVQKVRESNPKYLASVDNQ